VKKELKLDKLEVKAYAGDVIDPHSVARQQALSISSAARPPTILIARSRFAYTNTHFLTASRFVSKKSSKINSIDDLGGKSVVFHVGHHQHQAAH
jgi:glutamate/aspartate transport system substrate-binding protein